MRFYSCLKKTQLALVKSKFAEQHGDVIQWEQSNRAYILTHGVSGVEWTHYRHLLPEFVYDVCMKYWKGVYFVQ